MGIVFETKVPRINYKSEPEWRGVISRHAPLKGLTQRNIQFLKSLGLKIVAGGGN